MTPSGAIYLPVESIEDVLAEARRRGWRLCNFFEIEDGQFRVNFIVRDTGCSFGISNDPAVALHLAWQAAEAFYKNGSDVI